MSYCLASTGAASETESLSDAFEAADDILEKYRTGFELPEKTAGIIAVMGDRVVGIDLFDAPETFATLWPRLREGYYFEAAADKDSRSKAKKKTATDYLASIADSVRPAIGSLGVGTELEVSAQDIAGSGVWHDGRLCHLSAFACGRIREE